jgi:hypothetical protein
MYRFSLYISPLLCNRVSKQSPAYSVYASQQNSIMPCKSLISLILNITYLILPLFRLLKQLRVLTAYYSPTNFTEFTNVLPAGTPAGSLLVIPQVFIFHLSNIKGLRIK